MNIIEQYLRFKQNFRGDARAQIQQMLNSGQITQEQYNNAVKQAERLLSMLQPGGRR